MSVSSWLKNLLNPRASSTSKISNPMAKEADVKSPKRLFAELYGEPVEPKKTPKFIHAEKREKIVPATPSNTDLSELLDELTEESPFRSDAKSDAKNIS